MAFKPHLRLTMTGGVGAIDSWNEEIFSMSLSLEPDTADWYNAIVAVNMVELVSTFLDGEFSPNMTDIANDCASWFSAEYTGISKQARLKRVKLAAIGEDGRYISAPLEVQTAATGSQAAGNQTILSFPYQIARKVTLETDGDLGRVKGGFYIPAPVGVGFDPNTSLWGVTETEHCRDMTKGLIEDLANAPGFDAVSAKVVIASQGRHNKNGTVRQPPANYEVKRVNVGRRPDVLRSRANHISEARIADVSVSQ